MTASNFQNVLPVTLAFEGGVSMIRSDPGNWTGGRVGVGELKGTNKGIAASSHPNLDIMHLSDADVQTIYEKEYWLPSGANLQANGMDLQLFDASVNAGVSRGKKLLATSAVGAKSVQDQIVRYADARLSFYHRLSTWRSFGKGWTSRVAGVEAKALRMAAGPENATAVLLEASRVQRTKAKSIKTKASAATATSAGGSITAFYTAPEAMHPHPGLVVAIVAVIAIGVAVAAFLSWQNSTRARALTSELTK